MGETTGISWSHSTFNLRWGCTRVSPACDHCYAEELAHRFGHDVWGTDRRKPMSEHYWNEPLRWERKAAVSGEPWRVFCSSMADVFEDAPGALGEQMTSERSRLWALIEATPHLTWMLLTKRPQNVLRMVPPTWLGAPDWSMPGITEDNLEAALLDVARNGPGDPWPSNVWVGTTVENQRYADLRIPQLVAVPAPVRFVSAEPLLGPIDLGRWFYGYGDGPSAIHWVIVGGESGAGARLMDPTWARWLLAQADVAWVAPFFKQTGTVLARQWAITGKGHDPAEWPAEFRRQEFPNG